MASAPGRSALALAPTVVIGPASLADMGDALRMMGAAIEASGRDHYDARQRREILRHYASILYLKSVEPDTVWLARAGGRVVGLAQWGGSHRSDRGRYGVLAGLFVAPEMQGAGIGGRLLATIEAQARAEGCVVLQGYMALNAIPFYRAHGFQDTLAGHGDLGYGDVAIPILNMAKRL